jgi:hypothetical protein
MIPMLNSGSAGIKGMTEEAERLGLVIDQKTGTAAEEFNDAVRKLQLSFTGMGNTLMQDALPYMQKFADWVSNPVNQEGIMAFARGVADIASAAANAAMFVAGLTRNLLELAGVKFDDLRGLNEQLHDINEQIRLMTSRNDPLTSGNPRRIEQYNKLLAERSRLLVAIDEATGRMTAPALTIGVSRGAMDPAELLPPGDDPMEKFRLSAQKAFDATRSGLERAVADFAEFQIAVDTLGSETVEGMGVNVEQVFSRMRERIGQEMDSMAGKTKGASEEMNQYMIQAARNIQNAFADFLFAPFENGVKGMLEGLVKALKQMVAQIMALMVVKALAGLGGPIGSFFSMGLPSMDQGGRGTPGQPYLIGQKAQPEIFIPDSAGTFIPNADELGGGSNFNITIDARDPGAEGRIRTMIQEEMAPQIIEAATGRTMSMLRRPRFA